MRNLPVCTPKFADGKLSIHVKATFTSGGHKVKAEPTYDGDVITKVTMVTEGPKPGQLAATVMQEIDTTIEVEGRFAPEIVFVGSFGIGQTISTL